MHEGKIVLWTSNREWMRETFISQKSQFQVSCTDFIITTGAYIGASVCAQLLCRDFCEKFSPASSG